MASQYFGAFSPFGGDDLTSNDPITRQWAREATLPAAAAVEHVWWDGAAFVPATLEGWYVNPTTSGVTVLGQWDGSAIQSIVPAS